MNTEQPIKTTPTLKEKAIAFLHLVVSGKISEAYQRFVGADFIHHNPFFQGDAESLIRAMEENEVQNPNKILEVKLAIQEEDKVTLFSHIRQNRDDLGAAVVHIFRFEDGHIVELWDIGQSIPENPPNENGMF